VTDTTWGGARAGAGRKRASLEQRLREGTFRGGRHGQALLEDELPPDLDEYAELQASYREAIERGNPRWTRQVAAMVERKARPNALTW
jgi:hypothetical protein